jgi:EmrB/QacA subfamily drug resistance transporter
MVALDFFIVNVAIPSIQQDLQASAGMIEFVVAGYGLANAAALIIGGRLGDLYGRRKMLLLGLGLFTLASAACGFASSAPALVMSRLLQGVAGALLQPQVLAILGTVFSGTDRPRAFAWYGIVLGLAATGGQVIGGALIEANWAGLGWRSCFLINLPIGCLALMLVPCLVPAIPASPRQRLDLSGMALSTLSLVAVLLPLIEGREHGWPLWSWLCLLASAPLLLAFMCQQRRAESHGGNPLIPLSLLYNKVFSVGLLTTIVFYAGNASFYFVLALYLQQDLQMSAFAAGLVFSILAFGFVVTSTASAKLAQRFGARSLALGAVILTVGHCLQLLAVTAATTFQKLPLIGVILLIQGAGIGMVMAPLVATVLSGLPPAHAGVASGVLAMMQQTGNALGVAVIGIIFHYQVEQSTGTAGYARAFGASLVYLALLALLVTIMMQRLLRELRR